MENEPGSNQQEKPNSAGNPRNLIRLQERKVESHLHKVSMRYIPLRIRIETHTLHQTDPVCDQDPPWTRTSSGSSPSTIDCWTPRRGEKAWRRHSPISRVLGVNYSVAFLISYRYHMVDDL